MVDQDLFGPANCELFEEFKILMATRANYTANASVRYTTPLFSYISIFFSFFWRQLPFLVDVFYKVALSFFLFFSLFLIAVFSHLTAAQRLVRARRVLQAQDRRPTSEAEGP